MISERGGIAPQAINNRLATVNDAVAATGKTSTLPGNKCITVDELNAMVGGSSDREIPIVALENLMESGVSLLVLNYTDDAVGMINLDCNGYEDSYDLQNGNTAVCLNVGSRGDITPFRQFNVSIESGGYSFSVFTRRSGESGYVVAESYIDSSESDRYLSLSFGTNLWSALVIAEKLS